MPSPTNPVDVPAVWLSSPSQPKPAAYTRAVARKIKNNRHAKVLCLSNVAEDLCRKIGAEADHLAHLNDRAWRDMAEVAGKPSQKVSPETRAAVIETVRQRLTEPYQAKGRG